VQVPFTYWGHVSIIEHLLGVESAVIQSDNWEDSDAVIIYCSKIKGSPAGEDRIVKTIHTLLRVHEIASREARDVVPSFCSNNTREAVMHDYIEDRLRKAESALWKGEEVL
jgi:hypothetical protein